MSGQKLASPFRRALRWFGSDSPVSKAMIILWSFVGLLLWYHMIRADINVFVDVVLGAIALFFFIRSLELHKPITKRGIGVRFAQKSDAWSKTALAGFSLSFTTGWFFSALISGSWPGIAKPLASSCFGGFHLHHWQWSSALTIFFIAVFIYGIEYRARFSTVCLAVSGVLMGIVGIFFLEHGWFPKASGLWISLGTLSLALFSIGLALRKDRITSRWFNIFMCLQLGVVMGVACDGIIGIVRDYNSLVYISSKGCAYGAPNPAEILRDIVK